MTDVRRLPLHLIQLFEPPKPLRYVQPLDHAPDNRRTSEISSSTDVLAQTRDFQEDQYTFTESWLQVQKREKRAKQKSHQENLKKAAEEWNPQDDPHIRGDPFKTLFISRLSYETTEDDLEKECIKYGPIERVRLVKDKDQKSRGYAFVIFSRERDVENAVRELNGYILKGRRILADVERGRTVKDWKPRRLGGGKGGRGYTAPKMDSYKSKLERQDRFNHSYKGSSRPSFKDRDRDRERDRDRNRRNFNSPYSRPRYETRPRYDDQEKNSNKHNNRFDRPPPSYRERPREYSPSRTAGQYY